MPPRLNLHSARSLLRSTQCGSTSSQFSTDSLIQQTYQRCSISRPITTTPHRSLTPAQRLGCQRRLNSSSSSKQDGEEAPKDEADIPKGPTQDQLPDASTEAAEIAKITEKKSCSADGDAGGPELEQGTPVADVLKRDQEALKNMPKVLRDQLASSDGSKGSRSFSTSARRAQQGMEQQNDGPEHIQHSATDVAKMIAAAEDRPVEESQEAKQEGLKFPLPDLPLPKTEHLRRRYDPVLDHFTKMIMWDGKLSLAQKHMGMILDILRTSPPPKLDSRLLRSPDPVEFALNPVEYLTLVVDSVAPLLKIRQQKGAAGGGKSLAIPIPLSVRQRRRIAMKWIVNSSEKRRDPKLPNRVAQEIIAVAEGRSSIWDSRAQVHKQGTAARVNVNWTPKGPGRRKIWEAPEQTQPLRSDSLCDSSQHASWSTGLSRRNGGGIIDPSDFPRAELLERNDPLSSNPPTSHHSYSSLFSSDLDNGQYDIDPSFTSSSSSNCTILHTSFDPGILAFSELDDSPPWSTNPTTPWSQFLDVDAGANLPSTSGDSSQYLLSADGQGPPLFTGGSADPSPLMRDDALFCDSNLPSFGQVSFSTNAQDCSPPATSQKQSTYSHGSYDYASTTQSPDLPGQQQAGVTVSAATSLLPPPAAAPRTSPSASTSSSNSILAQSRSKPKRATQRSNATTVSSTSSQGVTPSDDPVVEKRRRNTLAARRFRQKQQDRVSQLERALEQVSKERDELKMQVARWEGETAALRGMLARYKRT